MSKEKVLVNMLPKDKIIFQPVASEEVVPTALDSIASAIISSIKVT